jgi:aspartyl/asparaginyl beta-hydroxylase (cupin superfamily)
VIPFTKSENVLEKRAAYDLNILLKCGINKTNNTVIMYLSDALDHLIKHFMPDLNNLINKLITRFNFNPVLLERLLDINFKTQSLIDLIKIDFDLSSTETF